MKMLIVIDRQCDDNIAFILMDLLRFEPSCKGTVIKMRHIEGFPDWFNRERFRPLSFLRFIPFGLLLRLIIFSHSLVDRPWLSSSTAPSCVAVSDAAPAQAVIHTLIPSAAAIHLCFNRLMFAAAPFRLLLFSWHFRNCSVPSQSRAKIHQKLPYGNGIFACWPMFSYGQRSKCADLLNSYIFVTVQYLHSHAQKIHQKLPTAMGFACWPMFSYGQRSKCADLLNSYTFSAKSYACFFLRRLNQLLHLPHYLFKIQLRSIQ